MVGGSGWCEYTVAGDGSWWMVGDVFCLGMGGGMVWSKPFNNRDISCNLKLSRNC